MDFHLTHWKSKSLSVCLFSPILKANCTPHTHTELRMKGGREKECVREKSYMYQFIFQLLSAGWGEAEARSPEVVWSLIRVAIAQAHKPSIICCLPEVLAGSWVRSRVDGIQVGSVVWEEDANFGQPRDSPMRFNSYLYSSLPWNLPSTFSLCPTYGLLLFLNL